MKKITFSQQEINYVRSQLGGMTRKDLTRSLNRLNLRHDRPQRSFRSVYNLIREIDIDPWERPYWTTVQVAEICAVADNTVVRWCRNGNIDCRRCGTYYGISQGSLRKFLINHPEIFHNSDRINLLILWSEKELKNIKKVLENRRKKKPGVKIAVVNSLGKKYNCLKDAHRDVYSQCRQSYGSFRDVTSRSQGNYEWGGLIWRKI
jgi:hypothetical protein